MPPRLHEESRIMRPLALIRIHIYVHIHAHIHTYIHTYTYMHTYIHMFTHGLLPEAGLRDLDGPMQHTSFGLRVPSPRVFRGLLGSELAFCHVLPVAGPNQPGICHIPEALP